MNPLREHEFTMEKYYPSLILIASVFLVSALCFSLYAHGRFSAVPLHLMVMERAE